MFADGCAGVFVYSWTDEWFRGGAEVTDWAFGITDQERRPKPALATVREGLDRWDKPAHVIWGGEDAVLPTAIAERFIALIPGATGPEVIPGAGHFLQEDAPAEVAAAIVRALGFPDSPERRSES